MKQNLIWWYRFRSHGARNNSRHPKNGYSNAIAKSSVWTDFNPSYSHASGTEHQALLVDKNMRKKIHFLTIFGRTSILFIGSLIPLIWTFGEVCPGFQGSITCFFTCVFLMLRYNEHISRLVVVRSRQVRLY